jgi:hypothetical protein
MSNREPEVAARIKAQVTKTGRKCGDCSLCCKLVPVPSIDKPENVWCKHCKPGKGGCAIQDNKPVSCALWHCAWLLDSHLGEHWFPRTSKMVMHPSREATGDRSWIVAVDPGFPLKWREEPYFTELTRIADWQLSAYGSLLKVCVGERTFAVSPTGQVVEISKDQGFQLNPDGTYDIFPADQMPQAPTEASS